MESKTESYDYLFKVVLVGDSGVGKSNLLTRFTKNDFHLQSRSTIGVEFACKSIEFDSKIIKGQIWDTAGQERFGGVTRAYFRGAVGALIVYDITKQSSFEHVSHWLTEIRNHSTRDTIILLVGNKSDLREQKVVSVSEVQSFAENNNLSFVETSALDSSNVDVAFHLVLKGIYQQMAQKVIRDCPQGSYSPTNTHTINISQEQSTETTKRTKNNRCCQGH